MKARRWKRSHTSMGFDKMIIVVLCYKNNNNDQNTTCKGPWSFLLHAPFWVQLGLPRTSVSASLELAQKIPTKVYRADPRVLYNAAARLLNFFLNTQTHKSTLCNSIVKRRAARHSCAINALPLPHQWNPRTAGVWKPSSLSSSWWPHAHLFSVGSSPGNPFQGCCSGAACLLLQCSPPAASCCCAGLGVRVCTKSKGEGENEQVREEAVLHLLALILANVSSKI